MQDVLIPIDKAGRLVLPKEVRDELSIEPGDLLALSVDGDQVTLRPNREKAGFIKQGAALVFSTGQAEALDNALVETIRTSEPDTLNATIAKGLPRRTGK